MTKKQLYGIGGALSVVVVFLLFMSTERHVTDLEYEKNEEVLPDTANHTQSSENILSAASTSLANNSEIQDEQVVLQGVFIGLLNGKDTFDKTFKYLLLDDGQEVLRIDLRPLVGYDQHTVLEQLDIQRNDVVRINGFIKDDGTFKVERIVTIE